jgi:hypothetical protein
MATQNLNLVELTIEELLRRSDNIRVSKVLATPSGDKIRVISSMISPGRFTIMRVGGDDSPLNSIVVNVPPDQTDQVTEEWIREAYELGKKAVGALVGLFGGRGGGGGGDGCKQSTGDINLNIEGGEGSKISINNLQVNVNNCQPQPEPEPEPK